MLMWCILIHWVELIKLETVVIDLLHHLLQIGLFIWHMLFKEVEIK